MFNTWMDFIILFTELESLKLQWWRFVSLLNSCSSRVFRQFKPDTVRTQSTWDHKTVRVHVIWDHKNVRVHMMWDHKLIHVSVCPLRVGIRFITTKIFEDCLIFWCIKTNIEKKLRKEKQAQMSIIIIRKWKQEYVLNQNSCTLFWICIKIMNMSVILINLIKQV